MKAVCWHGKRDIRIDDVPEPKILNPHDAIIRVTSTAICGSDCHLYQNFVPAMQAGDILGHEFMGEVVDVGRDVRRIKRGDRVIVPFPISCGQCFYCQKQLWSLCDNTNPNADLAVKVFGHSPAGIFGYSHLLGGYAGGQAEFVRVPFADVGCRTVPEALADEQVLFLTDILPTGFMAAENCGIERGDVVAVFGCGPVGQLAIQSAWMLGAERVIAIDRYPERLEMARTHGRAEVLDDSVTHVLEALKELTGGRGPDACIEAVGLEAHGGTLDALYDEVAVRIGLASDRAHALRQAIVACRKGGTVSMAGVFGGLVDKVPFGAAMNKALTLKMGQTHVHRYVDDLLAAIEVGKIDPSFIVSHRLPLSEAAHAYDIFSTKKDDCIKVVLSP